MYRTVEERLNWLEQTVERQAFQIELLQSTLGPQHRLYSLIIASNMSRECFLQLQALTKQYEGYAENGQQVVLFEFITAFERILAQHRIRLSASEMADLIPIWLGGKDDVAGFSTILYKHFYA